MTARFLSRMAVGLALVAVFALGAGAASAQGDPRFIRLSSKVKGALYLPDQQPAPRVGILLMHEDANFLIHLACTEFAKRGYAVMCVAGRSDNNEALDTWNELPLDAALGMKYLRERVKVEKVVLFAHSGGAPLMAYYQAVAEQGPQFCQDGRRLLPCPDELKGIPKADGMVFFDAHAGTAVNLLRSLDPSIVSEDQPGSVKPELDAFNPANGYNPEGPSRYPEEFKSRYFKAQAERMNRLVDASMEKLKLIKAGKYHYPDDDALVIPRTNARLMDLDVTIGQTTVSPRRLLRNDGSITTEVITSVKPPSLELGKRNRTFGESKLLTVLSFLGTRAIRATHAMDDYDTHSNNNSTEESVKHIRVPILIAAAGGYIFLRDDEKIFETAVSPDKEFIVVAGANHGITPCVPCEKTPGEYSNTVKNTFDYYKSWIDKRF